MIGLLCAILVTEIINRGAESQINNTVISKLYTREGLNNKIKILKYFQIIKILFRRSLYTLQFSGGGGVFNRSIDLSIYFQHSVNHLT